MRKLLQIIAFLAFLVTAVYGLFDLHNRVNNSAAAPDPCEVQKKAGKEKMKYFDSHIEATPGNIKTAISTARDAYEHFSKAPCSEDLAFDKAEAKTKLEFWRDLQAKSESVPEEFRTQPASAYDDLEQTSKAPNPTTAQLSK